MAMLLQYLNGDGKIVVAGAEIWIAAMMDSLEPRKREAVINRVQALDAEIQKQIDEKGRVAVGPLEINAVMNGHKK